METISADDAIETLGLDYLREQLSFVDLDDDIIVDLLRGGKIIRLAKGEYLARIDEAAADFHIVLDGELAYYKHCDYHDVLTRHFGRGEQVGFDEMIGLINRNGTDVAIEETLLLTITSAQFFDLHISYPAAFGVFMLNLAGGLSREIEILEDVIGQGTGWQAQ